MTAIALSNPSATHWDAIIIGAGIAGSIAAHRCATAGLRTLLIDRATMPRPKVCGCCLSPLGVTTLTNAGLASALESATPITTLDLWYNTRNVHINVPQYFVLPRTILDTRLVALARSAGATFLPNHTATVSPTPNSQTNQVTLRPASTQPAQPAPTPATLTATTILTCDGLDGSSLKDHPAFSWSIAPSSHIGLGATLTTPNPPIPLPPGRIAMLCNATGYLGLCTLPDGSTHAAAAVSPAALRIAGSPQSLLATFITRANGDPASIHAANWKGTPLLTRRRNTVAHNNILTVGDSAGYVEPFTGEGMTWAILSALAAADLIINPPSHTSLADAWSTTHAQLIASRQRTCGRIATLLRQPLVMQGITATSRFSSPLLSRIATRITRHQPTQAPLSFQQGPR
jgi:flavin-dependent dehydrogenase